MGTCNACAIIIVVKKNRKKKMIVRPELEFIQGMFGSAEKGREGDENGDENNLQLFGLQMKKGLNENKTEKMVGPTGKNFHPKCEMKTGMQRT